MTALPQGDEYVSKEEYFRILEASDERLEWIDGRIYPKNNPYGLLPEAMAGASDAHVDISSDMFIALGLALRGKPCSVVNQDQKVKAGNSFAFPDITVYCGEREKDEQGNLINPVVIVEVLSEGTKDYDRGAKWDKLRQLETLRDYLLVWQEKPLIEHRHRLEENHWDMIYYNRLEDSIDLEAIGVSLSLNEIYTRITFSS